MPLYDIKFMTNNYIPRYLLFHLVNVPILRINTGFLLLICQPSSTMCDMEYPGLSKYD